MKRNPPPPVIGSARVMSYAFVEDIPYRRYGSLYVDGKLLEHVPRLAICLNLGKDIGPLLLHCDEEWETLGVTGAPTIEGVKQLAERNYAGVAERWVDVNTSAEQGLEFYDRESGGMKCSFCRKRPFEFKGGWVEGDEAVICHECIEKLYRTLRGEPGEGGRR
jgi:hypothetical protein